MWSYVIKLENEAGDTGYHGLIGLDGEYIVYSSPDNALHFESEEKAEAAILRIEADHGIDRESMLTQLIADDRTAELELGSGEFPDGIYVVEENGKRSLLVRNASIEAGEDIPTEMADLLVPLLLRLQQLLKKQPKSR